MKKQNMTYNEKAHYHAGAQIVLEQLMRYLEQEDVTIEDIKNAALDEINYRKACVLSNRKKEDKAS